MILVKTTSQSSCRHRLSPEGSRSDLPTKTNIGSDAPSTFRRAQTPSGLVKTNSSTDSANSLLQVDYNVIPTLSSVYPFHEPPSIIIGQTSRALLAPAVRRSHDRPSFKNQFARRKRRALSRPSLAPQWTFEPKTRAIESLVLRGRKEAIKTSTNAYHSACTIDLSVTIILRNGKVIFSALLPYICGESSPSSLSRSSITLVVLVKV
jgi:hypothetical protein